jgi:hypothetical protein
VGLGRIYIPPVYLVVTVVKWKRWLALVADNEGNLLGGIRSVRQKNVSDFELSQDKRRDQNEVDLARKLSHRA